MFFWSAPPMRKNFLNGLHISSLEALNAQVRRWMEQVANVRVHRETGKRPFDAPRRRSQPLNFDAGRRPYQLQPSGACD